MINCTFKDADEKGFYRLLYRYKSAFLYAKLGIYALYNLPNKAREEENGDKEISCPLKGANFAEG